MRCAAPESIRGGVGDAPAWLSTPVGASSRSTSTRAPMWPAPGAAVGVVSSLAARVRLEVDAPRSRRSRRHDAAGGAPGRACATAARLIVAAEDAVELAALTVTTSRMHRSSPTPRRRSPARCGCGSTRGLWLAARSTRWLAAVRAIARERAERSGVELTIGIASHSDAISPSPRTALAAGAGQESRCCRPGARGGLLRRPRRGRARRASSRRDGARPQPDGRQPLAARRTSRSTTPPSRRAWSRSRSTTSR